MTRISKQQERRMRCPRRPKLAGPKTGPKKDKLPKGYKPLVNAIEGELASQVYFGKVK